MKPIEEFKYIRNNGILHDGQNLTRFYYPIIGEDAFILYQYFQAFSDDGQRAHRFSEVLNHTSFGMQRMEIALDVLMAMKLVELYRQPSHYLLKLCPPLSGEEFLHHSLYRQLLTSKIGEASVRSLEMTIPGDAMDISKNFSQVFTDKGEVESTQTVAQNKGNFDLDAFKQLMVRDGLSFSDEQTDVIGLYRLSEQEHMTWFDLYQVVKETAVNHRIHLPRVKTKLHQKKTAGSQNSSEFSQQEQVVIAEAKADTHLVFLAKMKKIRQAQTTSEERKLLTAISEQGFLDEVINIMVMYCLNRTNSANLNQNFMKKLANDFAYHKIETAEDAILYLRKGKATAKQPAKKATSNVPEWSNPNYQNKTTEADLAQMEAMRRELLNSINEGGD